MDVIEHLVQEHREVEELLERLGDSEPGDERRRTVEELVSSLSVHMAVEERFVYPIVVEVIGGDDELEGRIEHDLARDGLTRLQELVEQPGFGAAVAMVAAGIAHHVQEEEHEVFPTLRERAPEALEELADPEHLEAAVRGDAGAVAGGPSGTDGATREELYEQAKQLDIQGRSTMDKDQLAAAVENAS
jgi:hemerythrin-like domain-containing protein